MMANIWWILYCIIYILYLYTGTADRQTIFIHAVVIKIHLPPLERRLPKVLNSPEPSWDSPPARLKVARDESIGCNTEMKKSKQNRDYYSVCVSGLFACCDSDGEEVWRHEDVENHMFYYWLLPDLFSSIFNIHSISFQVSVKGKHWLLSHNAGNSNKFCFLVQCINTKARGFLMSKSPLKSEKEMWIHEGSLRGTKEQSVGGNNSFTVVFERGEN